MNMEWMKKQIKEPREVDNLKYLMALNPRLIPWIKNITDNYYMVERCEEIHEEDFCPANFDKLYFNFLGSLYKFRQKDFTSGIYKYFAPNSLNSKVRNQEYIPYIMAEFEEIIENVSTQVPKLLEDLTFIGLLKFLRKNSRYLKNWKPMNGYSLLHGDLHIGNIVKRNNNFLLIDFEYLRYGAVELETANLIISALIYYYKQNFNNGKQRLFELSNDYIQVVNKLPFLDTVSFQFFFIFSLSLFYLTAFLKKDKVGLESIYKIIKVSDIVRKDQKLLNYFNPLLRSIFSYPYKRGYNYFMKPCKN
jgi:hypothetical protein